MSEPHRIVEDSEEDRAAYWRRHQAITAIRAAQRAGLISKAEAERQIAEYADEAYAAYLRDWDQGLDSARR